MPNWCENKLTIRGKNGVLGCLDVIKGEPDVDGPRHIDFQRIVPMPAILVGTRRWQHDRHGAGVAWRRH